MLTHILAGGFSHQRAADSTQKPEWPAKQGAAQNASGRADRIARGSAVNIADDRDVLQGVDDVEQLAKTAAGFRQCILARHRHIAVNGMPRPVPFAGSGTWIGHGVRG